MNSSLQLVILDLIALAAAWLVDLFARGLVVPEREMPAAFETTVFLLYTATPPIGMLLAVVAIVMAVREVRARRGRREAGLAVLLSVGILVLVPRLFVAFTP